MQTDRHGKANWHIFAVFYCKSHKHWYDDGLHWAVCFWVGSCLALWQGRPVCSPPYSFPEAIVWPLGVLAEKWKARACPEFSFWVLIFVFRHSTQPPLGSLWPEAGAPSSFFRCFFSKKGYADDQGMVWQVKLVSALIVSHIEVWSCLIVNPDVRLASTLGGAATSMPPRK